MSKMNPGTETQNVQQYFERQQSLRSKRYGAIVTASMMLEGLAPLRLGIEPRSPT